MYMQGSILLKLRQSERTHLIVLPQPSKEKNIRNPEIHSDEKQNRMCTMVSVETECVKVSMKSIQRFQMSCGL